MDLTEIHQGQVARFVSFFKGKRDGCLNDRRVANEDFLSDHLSDDSAIFNRDQVMGMFQLYMQQTGDQLNEEIEKVNKLAAVYCTELMRAGQAQGVNLQTEDISLVEDQNRIDHVNALTSLNKQPMALPARSGGLLPTLGSSPAQDPALLQQVQDSREETRVMTERYQMMQNQVSGLLQERSGLSSELENVKQNFTELRTRMAASGADASSQQAAAEMEMKFYNTKNALDSKTGELEMLRQQAEAMRREQDGRLGDSTQFKQLKGIIKEKNTTIKTLRSQLQQLGYQPPGEELTADSD